MSIDDYKVIKVKKTTLNYTVYQAIKDGILKGDIPEGAKLAETQMAEKLGVSATPVREAFRMLATEGLINLDPYKGAVVSTYSPTAALEAVQCREALECLAVKLFMASKDVDSGLENFQEMLLKAQKAETINDFVKISSAIHEVWILGCKNAKVGELVEQLNATILRESNISANDKMRRKQIIEEHKTMLEAMKNKNVEGACAALMLHLENGYAYSQKQGSKS